jgi:hypothetical protein
MRGIFGGFLTSIPKNVQNWPMEIVKLDSLIRLFKDVYIFTSL